MFQKRGIILNKCRQNPKTCYKTPFFLGKICHYERNPYLCTVFFFSIRFKVLQLGLAAVSFFLPFPLTSAKLINNYPIRREPQTSALKKCFLRHEKGSFPVLCRGLIGVSQQLRKEYGRLFGIGSNSPYLCIRNKN